MCFISNAYCWSQTGITKITYFRWRTWKRGQPHSEWCEHSLSGVQIQCRDPQRVETPAFSTSAQAFRPIPGASAVQKTRSIYGAGVAGGDFDCLAVFRAPKSRPRCRPIALGPVGWQRPFLTARGLGAGLGLRMVALAPLRCGGRGGGTPRTARATPDMG